MQALRTGQGTREGLVTEFDPDSVNRGDGKSLAADDAVSEQHPSGLGTVSESVLCKAFEKTLTQSLYSFVRAGRLDEAVQLCRKAHQPWRAASIRGSLLFQWQAIGKSHEARLTRLNSLFTKQTNNARRDSRTKRMQRAGKETDADDYGNRLV